MSQLAGKLKPMGAVQIASRLKGAGLSSAKAIRSVYDGPVRNAWLIGKEFVGLVAKEQHFALPKAEQWGEAKQVYGRLLARLKPGGEAWLAESLGSIGGFTWSEAVQGSRVLAELAALYFMAQLAGKTLVLPVARITGRR